MVKPLPLRARSRATPEWTIAEIQALERLYPTATAGHIRETALPSRTVAAIRRQANEMGLQKQPRRPLSEEEAMLLHEHYSRTGGVDFLAAALNRTPHQVRALAQHYGMRRTDEREWTEQELQTLRAHYPTEGRGCTARLPGRSAMSVRMAAQRLGLRVNHERGSGLATLAWEPGELALLAESHTLAELCRILPHRTSIAIKARRTKLRREHL